MQKETDENNFNVLYLKLLYPKYYHSTCNQYKVINKLPYFYNTFLKSGVCFTLALHLNLGWPHFNSSIVNSHLWLHVCRLSCLVVSDSLWPPGLWTHVNPRFLCPWNFPGKNTELIFYFRGSSRPRNRTRISWVSGIIRWILYHFTTWKALKFLLYNLENILHL